jgi:hypothetical protein
MKSTWSDALGGVGSVVRCVAALAARIGQEIDVLVAVAGQQVVGVKDDKVVEVCHALSLVCGPAYATIIY